eukprot:9477645-Pyramimonas_sp.AAC.1
MSCTGHRSDVHSPCILSVSCVVFSPNEQGCSSMALAEGKMHTSERCQALGPPARGGAPAIAAAA